MESHPEQEMKSVREPLEKGRETWRVHQGHRARKSKAGGAEGTDGEGAMIKQIRRTFPCDEETVSLQTGRAHSLWE